jgi:tetratricopeptide (TPR) repeat protein
MQRHPQQIAHMGGAGMRWPSLLRVVVVALGVLLLNLFPSPVAFLDAMRLGDALGAYGDRTAAVQAYEQAAALDLRSPWPYLRMGQVYLDWHHWAHAGQAFRRANGRQATFEGWKGLGDSFAGRRDWHQATQAWLRALQVEPQDPELYVNLARASLAQSQFDQAQRQLQYALALAPDDRRAHGLLGLLWLGDPARARPHLEQVGDPALRAWLDRIELAQQRTSATPGAEQPAILAASLLLHLDQPALARRQLEEHLAVQPDDAEALATLGYTLDRLGETGAGRQALVRALNLDPDLALGYFFLGLHERDLGRWQSARDSFWEAVQRDPSHAAACAELGATYALLHDYEAAEEWYATAVEQAPAGQEVSFRLLQASFYLDYTYKVSTAGLDAAREAAQQASDDPHALDLLGWALYMNNQYAEAEATLQQALAQAPDLASAEFHLGSLYATTGRYALAETHLRRAVGLDTTGAIRSRADMVLRRLGR